MMSAGRWQAGMSGRQGMSGEQRSGALTMETTHEPTSTGTTTQDVEPMTVTATTTVTVTASTEAASRASAGLAKGRRDGAPALALDIGGTKLAAGVVTARVMVLGRA